SSSEMTRGFMSFTYGATAHRVVLVETWAARSISRSRRERLPEGDDQQGQEAERGDKRPTHLAAIATGGRDDDGVGDDHDDQPDRAEDYRGGAHSRRSVRRPLASSSGSKSECIRLRSRPSLSIR